MCIRDRDVSGVTDMNQMFHNATQFNGDLSKWDVSGVTDMNQMFHNATQFNGDLSKWDVSNVQNMEGMFEGAKVFNQSLSHWWAKTKFKPAPSSGMLLGAVAFKNGTQNIAWRFDDNVPAWLRHMRKQRRRAILDHGSDSDDDTS